MIATKTITNGREKIKQFQQFQSLSEIIGHQLISEQEKKYKSKKRIVFYPSSIGKCKRASVYMMMGEKPKSTSRQSQSVLMNGTYFHERIERVLGDSGVAIAPELVLKDETLHISGRSDVIAWNFLLDKEEKDGDIVQVHDPKTNELLFEGPQNHLLIVELKSIREDKFHKLKKGSPNAEHEMQLQLYMYLTGIRKGIIYYESKDTHLDKEYVIEYNEQLAEQAVAFVQEVINYAKAEELPPKEDFPTSPTCFYCDYRSTCHTTMTTDDFLNEYRPEEA